MVAENPDVRYGLEIIGDTIPGREGKGSSGPKVRYSPLRDQINTIFADEKYWRKWIAIADYGTGAVAGGAMRDMKHHYGDIPEVRGLTFTTHRYAIKDGETGEVKRDKDEKIVKRCKLLVKYDPDRVDDDKKAAWERNKIMTVGRDAAKKLGIDVDGYRPPPPHLFNEVG